MLLRTDSKARAVFSVDDPSCRTYFRLGTSQNFTFDSAATVTRVGSVLIFELILTQILLSKYFCLFSLTSKYTSNTVVHVHNQIHLLQKSIESFFRNKFAEESN